ncbi:hypothetical protein HN51_067032 [Arachis hypogaea]|uniref:lysophospholipid acyltransferase LPEAT2 n=1 Tax=Arachis hypogaea TaxID=3818 RepID=UPI000DECB2F8|nr:lysophospholipid acyltransferase LPEAT2 [Arachis hypogaea]QHO08430.1 Lysophospholipid acyltransferase [Arachis hypogaea]
MAENGITDPLLPPSSSSDHIILNLSESQRPSDSPNPFQFIGCSEPPSVPPASTVDPFRNGTQNVEGVYEWVKIVACLPLALVRVVVFGACLMVGYLATKFALWGWKDKENPMPTWRSRVMWVTRVCARLILFSFGYQWIKRRGKPAPREIAPIIVSNHVSYIEPIFYFYELFPTIVASESHDSIPCVGTIIRAMQVIYVNRFSPSSRREAVNEIKRRASCNGYPRVLLFPEGTTTNGRCLISFQLGAFIPGYPIQPIIVRYPHVHFDQSWGSISLGKLMFRMFTQFHNFFEVEYLPVVYPRDDKLESAAHYAERTGHAMASALNVVNTGHSYGDLMLHVKAQEAKQDNPSSYMVEMSRVEKLFKLSSTEALDFLNRFLSMNPDPSGRVQYHNFLRGLKLKACPVSEKIFAFLDVETSGAITFRQFLFGSAHVMKQPGFHHSCESAFSSCGGAVKDYIIEKELRDFIRPAIPGWKDDEVHELLVLFDHDNDGRIGKDDFLSCLRRNPLLIAFFNPHQLHHHTDIGGSENLQIL